MIPHFYRRGQTESSRQAGPVSQNQIRQREHDIEFCLLFSKPSVSGFLVFDLTLHNSENVFHLRPDRRFLTFPALDLTLGTIRLVFALRRPAIDYVLDSFLGGIRDDGIVSFLCSKIPAVAVYSFLFTMQEFRRHAYVMNICCGGLHGMHDAALPIYTNMGFIAKVPVLALLRLTGIRIPLLLLVFRRGGRGYDGGINNGSFLQYQAALHQHCHYLRK